MKRVASMFVLCGAVIVGLSYGCVDEPKESSGIALDKMTQCPNVKRIEYLEANMNALLRQNDIIVAMLRDVETRVIILPDGTQFARDPKSGQTIVTVDNPSGFKQMLLCTFTQPEWDALRKGHGIE